MVEVDVIRQGLELGLTELGENRAQELSKRASMIEEWRSRRMLMGDRGDVAASPNWHMIGSLQRNKVKLVLPWARTIHSIDSLRLAEDISKHSVAMNQTTDVLLQINVSEERSKHGVVVGAANYVLQDMARMPNIRVAGLMTMAPLSANAEDARPYFARLHEIFEDIRTAKIARPHFKHLSMGMSGDFETAIEEGATMIRIGSALYEGVTAAAL